MRRKHFDLSQLVIKILRRNYVEPGERLDLKIIVFAIINLLHLHRKVYGKNSQTTWIFDIF